MTTTSNAKTWIVAEYRNDDFFGQTENLTQKEATDLANKMRAAGLEVTIADGPGDLESF